MATFNGQLRSNEIFAALYNMIISQQVFADNIATTQSELVDMAKVDGSLLGDSRLYYSTDILGSEPWGNDAEATNLLALHRPSAPDVQKIVLDQFRQISLTVDNYLSKRAWGTEGAFASFNGVMTGWIGETKRIYEAKLFNTFIGTNKATGAAQNVTLTLPTDTDPEGQARLRAQAIAKGLADLFVAMADAGRAYNDNGNYRSFDKKDMVIVWNADYANEITKVDLPTVFHDEKVGLSFDHVLPAKYFGELASSSGVGDGSYRSFIEKDYNTVARTSSEYDKSKHIFPGDVIPTSASFGAYEAYLPDSSVICKVYHKNAVPMISAFEVGTSFYNPKSLTENQYLTWGYNTLENLDNYPFVTVKEGS